MMGNANRLLKAIMQKVHSNRRPLSKTPITVVRSEVADGKPMCEIWFMSEGCAYDREGGCTMCNYGKGHCVEPSVILKELSIAVQDLPKAAYNLVVNPSGSFLDEREVSLFLREGIYELLDSVPFESLTIESRADILHIKDLNELKSRYADKRVSVEVGVETLNPWLLRNSVNKGITPSQIENAVHIIHEAGLFGVANIGLGLPFINERTNISEAGKSILDAIAMGFDSVILFPYHVKPGTLLQVLFPEKYSSVSLWSLVETLTALPSKVLPRVNISWYRNYYTDKSKIIASPDTCPKCRDTVLHFLDNYKSAPCDKTLAALSTYTCDCRNAWRKMIDSQPIGIEIADVESSYRFLADSFCISADLLETELQEMRGDIIC